MALEIKKQDLEAWMAKDAILYLRYMLGYDGISGNIQITLPFRESQYSRRKPLLRFIKTGVS